MARTSVLSSEVYESVKKQIRDGTLAAGQFLRELELMKEQQLKSRAPVRDALARLVNEGFLIDHPGSGKQVADIWEAAAQLIIQRAALDEFIGSELARQPRISLEPAIDINNQMRDIARSHHAGDPKADLAELVRLDGEFHAKLAVIARHPSVAKKLRELRDRLQWLAKPYVEDRDGPLQIVAEHDAILRAIRPAANLRGSNAVVRLCVRQHIENATKRWRLGDRMEPHLATWHMIDEPRADTDTVGKALWPVREKIEELVITKLSAHPEIDLAPAILLIDEMDAIAKRYSPRKKGVAELSPQHRADVKNLDLAFHCTLAFLSRQFTVEEILQEVWVRIYPFTDRGLSRAPVNVIVEEHREVIAQIQADRAAKSGNRGWKAMKAHLDRAFERNVYQRSH